MDCRLDEQPALSNRPMLSGKNNLHAQTNTLSYTQRVCQEQHDSTTTTYKRVEVGLLIPVWSSMARGAISWQIAPSAGKHHAACVLITFASCEAWSPGTFPGSIRPRWPIVLAVCSVIASLEIPIEFHFLIQIVKQTGSKQTKGGVVIARRASCFETTWLLARNLSELSH